MRRSLLAFVSGVALLGVPQLARAHAPDAKEEAQIVRAIVAACPGQRALAERASSEFHGRDRQAALTHYEELARCAKSVAIVHVRIGFLKFEARDFASAEARYRAAVALDPTFTNRLSLLEALTRQHKPEAGPLYAELSRYDGDRDDIWAALSYVAFHRDDVMFMRKASARAIALGTRWWQPWFTAAVAEGLAERPDYPRALGQLDRATALGGPPKIIEDMRAALREGESGRAEPPGEVAPCAARAARRCGGTLLGRPAPARSMTEFRRTQNMKRPPDVEAEIRFLPTAEGGRTGPVSSGYRPAHLVRDDYLSSGVHDYLDGPEARPGETVRATITFLAPEAYPESLWVGKVVNVQEGSRVVGHAKIVKIFNQVLAASRAK